MSARTASAQPAASADGIIGLRGSIGPAVPTDKERLDGAPVFAAGVDAHFSDHLALSAEVGTVAFQPERPRFTTPLRSTFVAAGIRYALRFGAVRPYAVLGVGIYHFNVNPGPTSHETINSDNQFRPNVGGGLELGVRPRLAILADVRRHAVGEVMAVVTHDGSFTTISAGVKRYF